MDFIPLTFKTISLTFTGLAIWTGANGLFRPTSFAADFGLPIDSAPRDPLHNPSLKREEQQHQQPPQKPTRQTTTDVSITTRAYVRLMSVRQLATGVILAIFARQGKWDEMATVLATIGVVVAGTDGYFLASVAGRRDLGVFHALPGGLIALLSAVFLWRKQM